MYKKICPFCQGNSYSASTGKWICPYCEADLTILMPEPAGGVKKNSDEPAEDGVVCLNKKAGWPGKEKKNFLPW